MNEDHSVISAILRIIFAWAGFIGSLSLAQWQAMVAIFGGLAVIVFTTMQIYVLWRDKIVKYRPPGSMTRVSDETGPTPL